MQRKDPTGSRRRLAELLFWPVLLLYGEAAVGYLGEARRPGSAGRAATWGVRLGWLAQSALLIAQAAREDGFPWGTWAGSLNLFVWLVLGAYLIWGCRGAYRLLGLGVMPLAASLFVVARAGGGTGVGTRSQYSTVFLVLHVGLVLVAFAGFTLAAALSGLYLWQERRLKRRGAAGVRGARAVAGGARPARRADDRRRVAGADARDRGRRRPSRPCGERFRRAHRRDAP